MKPYYSDDWVTLYHGDCREVLPTLKPVETCITDPPYGLSFMGQDWDHGVPGVHFWEAVMDALLPGALLFAFGGTRTWHRLACGIEDAGFELRDTVCWLYGAGFPKSLDISKAIDKAAGAERDRYDRPAFGDTFSDDGGTTYGTAISNTPATEAAKLWDGWGTAMKPAWEPVIVSMKPLDGTFAENAMKHGVAGLHIDGGRIGMRETNESGWSKTGSRASENRAMSGPNYARPPKDEAGLGRWPANVILDEEAAAMLDAEVGEAGGGLVRPYERVSDAYYSGRWPDSYGGGYDDSGGPSRFFYTSKASRAERAGTTHPTVKPLDLMAYLCNLTATPLRGTVLDPFAGSGSTLIAARQTGRKAIGIEESEEWCEQAVKRYHATFGGQTQMPLAPSDGTR